YTDVILAAAATTLRDHPRLRSRFDGDAVVVSEKIDVGIAVALDAGLIVPVLRDADRKSLAALREEREALETAVRSGRARADAFGGAARSEEHTSELQSRSDLVCRLLLEKKKKKQRNNTPLIQQQLIFRRGRRARKGKQ